MMPKVTVFTQAYNTVDYIERSIRSVLEQSLEDFEYIIVDNGSTDGTSEIIRQFADRDSRMRVIRFEENRTGFWTGFVKKEMTGEFFTNLDSDDWFEKDFLRKSVDFMEENDLQIGVAGTRFHFEKNGGTALRQAQRQIIVDRKDIGGDFAELYPFFRTVWGKVFSKTIIQNVSDDDYLKIYKTGYGGDTVFCLDSVNIADRIGVMEEVLHNYLVRNKSTSTKFNPKRVISDLFLFDKAERFLVNNGLWNEDNFLHIFIIYANAIMDTIDILLKTELDFGAFLKEIKLVVKDDKSKAVFEKIKDSDRLENTKLAILAYVMRNQEAWSGHEKDIVHLLTVVKPEWSPFVDRMNVEVFLGQKEFLWKTVGKSEANMFNKALDSIEDPLIGDSLEQSLQAVFQENNMLHDVMVKDFIIAYERVVRSVYAERYEEALGIMYDMIISNQAGVELEKFMGLFINLAAFINSADYFIYGKKVLCDYHLRTQAYDKAKRILLELQEMIPDDRDVIELAERSK